MFCAEYFPSGYFARRYFTEQSAAPAPTTGIPRVFSTMLALGGMASVAPRFYASVLAATQAPVAASPPPSYTGPLDLTATPAVVAYGQRALSAAMLGSALYTIRRSSDDATQSFSSDAVTGNAPVASISAFIGGGNGFVATWNDQSGSDIDVAQATATKQPPWIASAINSRPSLQWPIDLSNNDGNLLSSATVTFSSGQPYSVMAVIKVAEFAGCLFRAGDALGNFSTGIDILGSHASPEVKIDAYDPTHQNVYVCSAGTPALSDQYTLLETTSSVAAGNLLVSGAAQALDQPSATSPAANTNLIMVGWDPSTNTDPFQGEILELIVYASILSDADRAAIRQNIAAYYGIVLS